MPIELARRLIAAGAVDPGEAEAALFLSIVRGVPFARALVDRGAIMERELEDELERVGGLSLRHVVPSAELVARLPRAMCRRLAALPTRLDPLTGVVEVAAADPLDAHVAAEFGFQLGAPVRVLRASIAAVEEAIRQLELGEGQGERTRQRRATPPFPHGAPQSTIPPPPSEELAIPLVRRVEVEPDTREMSTRRRPPQEDEDDVVLPLSKSKLDGPVVSGRVSFGAAPDAPRVSFPSQPPDGAARWDSPVRAVGWNGAPRDVAATQRAPSTRPPSVDDAAITPPLTYERPRGDASAEDPEELAFGAAAAPPVEIAAPRLPRDLAPLRPTIASPSPSTAPDDAGQSYESSQPPRRRTARPPLLADLGASVDQRNLSSAVMQEALAAPPMPVIAPPPVHAPRSAVTHREGTRGRRGTLPPPYGSPDSDEGGRILRAVRDAPNRDELVRLALRGERRVARRVAVFAVRKDGYQGWACNVEFGDQDALKQIHIPGDVPSVLATASATSFYLGPIPSTPGHAALLRLMDTASNDVAAVAVRVSGRAAMVLLADELDDTMLGTRFLDELARAASDTLSRFLGR
jgi:hypothetical protein